MTIDADKQAEADFKSGFDDPSATPRGKKPASVDPVDDDTETGEDPAETADAAAGVTGVAAGATDAIATTAEADGAAAVIDPAAAADPAAGVIRPKPRKATRLTPEEVENLRALAAEVPEQKKQLSKAFGTIGSLTKQLNDMKSASEEKTKAAEPPPTPEEMIERRIRKEAMADLEEDYPDWREIVGASEKPDPEHPFRKWLATQPAEYQTKINASNSARTISRAIEKFKDATKESPQTNQRPNQATDAAGEKAAAARRNLIANNVTPKTAGALPAKGKTANDEFAEGFASG